MTPTALHFEATQHEGLFLVRLEGTINEDNRLQELLTDVSGRGVVFHLGKLERITSSGVRDWVRWLEDLEKLAADFNASQGEFRIVPTYKGNYTETVTASIFAFRSRSQPAIVQVNEIATATMMAARGAIYPVYELMRDQKEEFSPGAYLPAVSGY